MSNTMDIVSILGEETHGKMKREIENEFLDFCRTNALDIAGRVGFTGPYSIEISSILEIDGSVGLYSDVAGDLKFTGSLTSVEEVVQRSEMLIEFNRRIEHYRSGGTKW